MTLIPRSLQAAITKPGTLMSFTDWKGKAAVLTIFCFLPVDLKAHFDLDRRDRHDLSSQYMHCVHVYEEWLKKASHLVRTAYGLRPNGRQTNVVKLSFLHHFVEHLPILLDIVVQVESCWLE
jgi:hypothetical protein